MQVDVAQFQNAVVSVSTGITGVEWSFKPMRCRHLAAQSWTYMFHRAYRRQNMKEASDCLDIVSQI